MPGVYWGIVAGLAAMVVTLLVCIEVLYSEAKGSPPALSGKTNEPGESVPHASTDHRQAA